MCTNFFKISNINHEPLVQTWLKRSNLAQKCLKKLLHCVHSWLSIKSNAFHTTFLYFNLGFHSWVQNSAPFAHTSRRDFTLLLYDNQTYSNVMFLAQIISLMHSLVSSLTGFTSSLDVSRSKLEYWSVVGKRPYRDVTSWAQPSWRVSSHHALFQNKQICGRFKFGNRCKQSKRLWTLQ